MTILQGPAPESSENTSENIWWINIKVLSLHQNQTDKTMESKLTKAFKALRKAGYFARQNFWCCQTCGWYAVPDGKEDKVVFYHAQDNESRKEGDPFHVSWAGDGHEICKIFHEFGIATNWDGSPNKRIELSNYN